MLKYNIMNTCIKFCLLYGTGQGFLIFLEVTPGIKREKHRDKVLALLVITESGEVFLTSVTDILNFLDIREHTLTTSAATVLAIHQSRSFISRFFTWSK
jgi:hypothetical protein